MLRVSLSVCRVGLGDAGAMIRRSRSRSHVRLIGLQICFGHGGLRIRCYILRVGVLRFLLRVVTRDIRADVLDNLNVTGCAVFTFRLGGRQCICCNSRKRMGFLVEGCLLRMLGLFFSVRERLAVAVFPVRLGVATALGRHHCNCNRLLFISSRTAWAVDSSETNTNTNTNVVALPVAESGGVSVSSAFDGTGSACGTTSGFNVTVSGAALLPVASQSAVAGSDTPHPEAWSKGYVL
jgi:hypothetical protein